MKFDFEQGEVILIDKPLEWTSFDAVKKIRNSLRIKKIGHAGTLDPLATGLLILCTGKKTKEIDGFMGQPKEYTGSMILGFTTPSYDLETEPENEKDLSFLTPDTLKDGLEQFRGQITQIPPKYSAVKVDGKRSYTLARQGKEVKINPRAVEIMMFELEAIELPRIDFRVRCSKGTYIRSLVHDYGQALGVGAYLSALRRTRIGDFSVDNAFTIEEFIKEAK